MKRKERKRKKKHSIVVKYEHPWEVRSGVHERVAFKINIHSLLIFSKQMLLFKVKIYKGKFNYTPA